MKRSKVIVIGAFGMLLACSYLAVSAPSKKRSPQGPTRPSRKAMIPTPEMLEKLDGGDDPARRYTIIPIPIRGAVKARTPQEEELFKQATAIMLRERPVPPDRLQFFKWIDEGDYRFKLCGWSAFVDEVVPAAGGWGIRLSVWPQVTTEAKVINNYYEEYAWADGVLKFVKGYGNPRISGICVVW
ncbi:hypothetical protein [Singulisphaera acidiphila]|uniref:hypothetical protein n=1 Tax=Singulisphaera acidiphila TaxID=466153 RepID=UPI0002470ECD|nr:hypothetical protein [Singulisphaera acidiphila]